MIPYANAERTRRLAVRLAGILCNPRPGVRWRRDWSETECDRIEAVLRARSARAVRVPDRPHAELTGYRTNRRST